MVEEGELWQGSSHLGLMEYKNKLHLMSSASQTAAPADSRTIITRKLAWEQKNPSPYYKISLTKSGNLYEIHFSCKGPKDTLFDGGIYHGKLVLSSDFPFSPPDLMMITPSGRFVTNKKICFSYTSYHPETWSPSLKFRDIIIGFLSLFSEYSENGIGMITTINEPAIAKHKQESRGFTCLDCGMCHSAVLQELEGLERSQKG